MYCRSELLNFCPSIEKIGRGLHEILLVENSNWLFHVLAPAPAGVPSHNMARKRHAKAIPQRKLDYVRIKKEGVKRPPRLTAAVSALTATPLAVLAANRKGRSILER